MLHCADLFYEDNILVTLTELVWMQGTFNALTELFNRLGIWANVGKKFGRICRHCHEVGTQVEAAYKRRMKEEGLK